MRLRFGAALVLVLALCMPQAFANDISNWSGVDANNNLTPPNGWPSGIMLPSQVEPTGRAMMGAIARWYALMGGTNAAGIANTTAVRAATTTNYPNGFFRLTDGVAGAPPLRYIVDTHSVCAADDGGSCIAASGGGYFIAQFPGNIADIREWGTVADNTTDNKIALQSALTWATTNGGSLWVPNGEFYASLGVTGTVPASTSIVIDGFGKLRFGPSAGNGITLNVTGSQASVHIDDVTIITSGAGNGDAIHLHQTQANASPGYTAQSDISNVYILGDGAGTGGTYWANGVWVDSVSNIAFDNDYITGAFITSPTTQYANGNGINLVGGGDGNHFGVVYNINGGAINVLDKAIIYGSWIQGVAITGGFNTTGTDYGVYIAASGIGQDQLSIGTSQFNCYTSDVTDLTGINDVNINGAMFYMFGGQANTNVLYFNKPERLSIDNNIISNATNTSTSVTGIDIATTDSGSVGVINDNNFQGLNKGILLGATTANIRAASNVMNSVTTPYTTTNSPTGFKNYISNVYPALTTVSNVGATGLSPNYVQLTVASTAGFYSGEWVCVSGTTAAPDPNASTCTTISITDGTHIVEQGVGASGSSTASGGIVAAIP